MNDVVCHNIACVIEGDLPFEEVEAQAVAALERQGYVAQRTFSLRSAIRGFPELSNSGADFTVLLLYHSGPRYQQAGMLTLHELQRQTVIRLAVTREIVQEPSPGGPRAPAGAEPAHQHEQALASRILSALVDGGLGVRKDALEGGATRSAEGPRPIDGG